MSPANESRSMSQPGMAYRLVDQFIALSRPVASRTSWWTKSVEPLPTPRPRLLPKRRLLDPPCLPLPQPRSETAQLPAVSSAELVERLLLPPRDVPRRGKQRRLPALPLLFWFWTSTCSGSSLPRGPSSMKTNISSGSVWRLPIFAIDEPLKSAAACVEGAMVQLTGITDVICSSPSCSTVVLITPEAMLVDGETVDLRDGKDLTKRLLWSSELRTPLTAVAGPLLSCFVLHLLFFDLSRTPASTRPVTAAAVSGGALSWGPDWGWSSLALTLQHTSPSCSMLSSEMLALSADALWRFAEQNSSADSRFSCIDSGFNTGSTTTLAACRRCSRLQSSNCWALSACFRRFWLFESLSEPPGWHSAEDINCLTHLFTQNYKSLIAKQKERLAYKLLHFCQSYRCSYHGAYPALYQLSTEATTNKIDYW